MYMELTKEQNLVVLGSRLTFSDKDIMDLNNLLQEKNRVDFFEFLKLSIYHKTFVLCMDNIMKYGASFRIPSYLYMQYVFLKNGFEKRNRLMRLALEEFQNQCEENSVTIIPVKGAYLLNEIYTDQSVRYQGDIDILFDYDDLERITVILKESGYTAGRYDLKKNIVTPMSRTESVRWKLFMSHLPPYIKPIEGDPYTPFVKFDLRFALDDELDEHPVQEMIREYRNSKVVMPEHIVLHMCTHFYDEANHLDGLLGSKNLNLIKLCDLREYILHLLGKNNNSWMDGLFSFARKYGLEKQVYFTMFYLFLVYDDEIAREILMQMRPNIDNNRFQIEMIENGCSEERLVYWNNLVDTAVARKQEAKNWA